MRRTLKTDFKQKHLDLWLLVVRIVVALFMFTHGFPKFLRLIGSDEIRFADPFGLGPAATLALAVFSEVFCSTLILIGLATRVATLPLIATMLTAAFVMHHNDPFSKMELPLLYCSVYLFLLILGSGRYSVDYLLSQSFRRG